MNHPRSAFGAPPRGGDPSGRAKPVRGVHSVRWRRLVCAVSVALLAACHGAPQRVQTQTAPLPDRVALPAGYRLVWADEFDAPGLPDPKRWVHDTGRNREGWYNRELQYYSGPRAANAEVRGGRLHLTARAETLSSAPDWGGQRYTSARLITRGTGDWTYGFFEIRAKIPCGRGTWPAIWTVGSDGRWPEDGELDILEHVGQRPGRVFSTVHTAAGSGSWGSGADLMLPDVCTAFHDYQMHWTPTHVDFAIDGRPHYRYLNHGGKAWPFDRPQFLILNIAIGGDLGGEVDDAALPATMEVEHVRVWQR